MSDLIPNYRCPVCRHEGAVINNEDGSLSFFGFTVDKEKAKKRFPNLTAAFSELQPTCPKCEKAGKHTVIDEQDHIPVHWDGSEKN